MLAAGWIAAPGLTEETVAEPSDDASTEPSATPTVEPSAEEDCVTEMALTRPAPLHDEDESDDDDDNEFEDESDDDDDREDDDDFDDESDVDSDDDAGSDGSVTEPVAATTTDCVTPTPTPSATADQGGAAEVSQTFTGAPITNLRGVFQVQIVVLDGLVADVVVLQAGTDDDESIHHNEDALPILIPAMVDQQTWDVAYVSGSTYTSEGITASAQDAFSQAGLG